MKSITFRLLSILCVVMLMAACTSKENPSIPEPPGDKENPVSQLFDKGYIVQQDGNGASWLITQYHEGPSSKVDATWVGIVKETIFEDSNGGKLSSGDFKPGQFVEVWITGPIRESYPSQATAAKIIRIQEQQEQPSGMVSKDAAIHSALKAAQSQGWTAIKKATFNEELQVWVVELLEGGTDVTEPTIIHIDGSTGEMKPQPVAENNAFRIFSPAPDTEVGSTFKVKGEARVFEAAFSWMLEDGHDVLAEGHVMADKGAPEWGSFEFEVSYKNATNQTLMLIIYVASAKDGSMEHEIIIPLKLKQG